MCHSHGFNKQFDGCNLRFDVHAGLIDSSQRQVAWNKDSVRSCQICGSQMRITFEYKHANIKTLQSSPNNRDGLGEST